MSPPERTLYQFPISHYCEKSRWNLDAKGLSYEVKNLIPGPHVLRVKRLTGGRMVPVLVDRGLAIGDSTSIALHLEDAYPERPLLPKDPEARSRALEIEDFFDRKVGPAVRKWVYGELMRAGTGLAAEALLEAYPAPIRFVGKLGAPMLEREIRRMYRINHESVAAAREDILAGADRIEAETGGDPSRYLVGDALSIADITAASLLAAFVTPPGSPYKESSKLMLPTIAELRNAIRERPAGRWVAARYAGDRGRPA